MGWLSPKPLLGVPEEDLKLAARCRQNDGEAKAELFRRHAQAVYRLIRRFITNASDAEDLLQQVFLDALLGIGRYRGEAPLKSWVHKIAVRAVFHHLKRKKAPAVPLDLVGDEALAGAALEPKLESRAALRKLAALLEEISAKRRVVFVLHEVEGYSLPEVAAMLDISTTAAKKRVWQARRDLERLALGDPYFAKLFARREQEGEA
jgi:RNA polymerase sigma-70 factor, ECF subfamily